MQAWVKGWFPLGKTALCSGDRCTEPCLLVVNLTENAEDFVATRVATLAKVQTSCREDETILKSRAHQDTCSVQLLCTGTHASHVEPGSHLLRTHLLQKLTLHCCQPNHKLASAQHLFGIKEKEMWNSKGFELGTCQTISPAGLSLYWSHCRCINLYHLRLNLMPTEQAYMLQIISSTYLQLFWRLCINPLHKPHIWPHPPQMGYPLSSISVCYPTFLPQHLRGAHQSISTLLKIISTQSRHSCVASPLKDMGSVSAAEKLKIKSSHQ